MKIYLRILAYAKPIRRLVPFYCLAVILAVVFALINISLIIPLLEVLFSSTDVDQSVIHLPKPCFHWKLIYLKDLFQYYFIHVIATHGRVNALYFVCIIITFSVLLTNIFRYLAEIIVAEVRTKIVCNLRMQLFINTAQLHLGYFISHNKGDIIARIINDVQEVEYAITDIIRVCFKEPATIIGFFVVMYCMSSQLTIWSLVVLPITGIVISYIVGRLRQSASQTQSSLARLVHILQEALGGMRIIKAFAARMYVINTFQQENRQYAYFNLSMELKKSMASPMSELLGVIVVSLVLACGGKQVLMHETALAPSTLITYIVLFSRVLIPIKSISKSFSNIQRGRIAGERIFELIDTPSDITNKPDAIQITSFEKDIRFKNVNFSYQKQRTIKNLNLTIPKGKIIALVGPSGGGKSTIVDLLARLYEVTEGAIEIDGISLRDYDMYDLQKLIGIVTQETLLLHDTVYNNIAFGRHQATQESVIAAAQIAHAHAFITELPQGYQTIIGERGNKLSGGQAQRLSIARAVLENPPILILDEATSALDSAAEQLVQKALDQYMKDRTAIIISHRLSTIRHADEILVIDKGEIVEKGNHEVLMAQEGLYKTLSKLQDTA